jgi:hypothetical protein
MSKLNANPAMGEQFIKSKLDGYKQHFSEAELFLLIECPYFNSKFSVSDSKSVINELTNNERKYINPSSLNFYVRPDCTCYYSISCSGSGNSCEDKKDDCIKKAECGLSGTSNCTGRCTNDINPT